MHPVIEQVTQDIIERSKATRNHYLERMKSNYGKKVNREKVGCTNFAHAIAAEKSNAKIVLKKLDNPNIAIVTAYNDILSAHSPYATYPEQLKATILANNGTAQVAGGVPAMCDGVTQGQIGMELSLFSRDVIALATAISLSHNVFDGVLTLGICDKIVPGLLIGALSFGYLPTIFVPAGPMPSGISNQEKAHIRKLYAEKKVGVEELLKSEMKSYHAPGTCTFYGTANSNQVLMEVMGLHVPGSAFIPPDSMLRNLLTDFAAKRVLQITALGQEFIPLCEIISERTIVNAIATLIATGGSTNHSIHIPAIARAAGIVVNWDDFARISEVVPLLARVYPNGDADINQFHLAGGVAYIIKELLQGGFLHEDVYTVMGKGLSKYTQNPILSHELNLVWGDVENKDYNVVRPIDDPFSKHGGFKLLTGNLGRAVSKISAIKPEHHYVRAKARVFNNQEDAVKAYNEGSLNCDCIVVLSFQGPRANGMPELHGLTPLLASLQDQGFKIGLVTDGRLSGASGKVPNALHLTPEALTGGNIAKIHNDDIIELDLENGKLNVELSADELLKRNFYIPDLSHNQEGIGRELFYRFRETVSSAEAGASVVLKV